VIYLVSLKENSPLIYVSFNRKNPGSLFQGILLRGSNLNCPIDP
jgi:hypothetical protein